MMPYPASYNPNPSYAPYEAGALVQYPYEEMRFQGLMGYPDNQYPSPSNHFNPYESAHHGSSATQTAWPQSAAPHGVGFGSDPQFQTQVEYMNPYNDYFQYHMPPTLSERQLSSENSEPTSLPQQTSPTSTNASLASQQLTMESISSTNSQKSKAARPKKPGDSTSVATNAALPAPTPKPENGATTSSAVLAQKRAQVPKAIVSASTKPPVRAPSPEVLMELKKRLEATQKQLLVVSLFFRRAL
jgi:hypothetical protein